MTIPIISDILERFFGSSEDVNSRDDVKRRLQIVLAHDRLALDPQTLEMMRQEIIAVVSRYVEVDFESLEFSLSTDQRVTALTANLPIRRIRPLGRGADQPIESDDEAEKIELASQSEIMALDAIEAEAALKRFEADNINAQNPTLIHAPLDIDRDSKLDAKDRVLEGEVREENASSETEGSLLDQAEDAVAIDYKQASETTEEQTSKDRVSEAPISEAPISEDHVSEDHVSEDHVSEDPIPEVPDMSIPDATV